MFRCRPRDAGCGPLSFRDQPRWSLPGVRADRPRFPGPKRNELRSGSRTVLWPVAGSPPTGPTPQWPTTLTRNWAYKSAVAPWANKHDIRPCRPTYRFLRGDPAKQQVAKVQRAALKERTHQQACVLLSQVRPASRESHAARGNEALNQPFVDSLRLSAESGISSGLASIHDGMGNP